MAKYAMTLETLKKLDEGQLKEMFKDINDKAIAYKIMNAASDFICEEDDKQYRCSDEDDDRYEDKSEYSEWKQIDDAQRYREWEANQRGYY